MGNLTVQTDKQQILVPKNCCDKFSLFISNKNVDPSDVTCSICFEIYQSPRIMKCKHIFCSACIQDWGKSSIATCPYCRTELKKSKDNFGRIDKKMERIISALTVKCRSCAWSGSIEKYMCDFQKAPFLDEDFVPCEKTHSVQDGNGQNYKENQQCGSQKICDNHKKTEPENSTQYVMQMEPLQQQMHLLIKEQELHGLKSQFQEDIFLQEFDEPNHRYTNFGNEPLFFNQSYIPDDYFGLFGRK